MRHLLCCAAFMLLSLAHAESLTLELSVESKQHLEQAPVSVTLTLPPTLADANAVKLKDESGHKIPAQLTAPSLLAATSSDQAQRELHFVLPEINANTPVKLTATISVKGNLSGTLFSWQDTAGEYSELTFGKKPVLRYMYKALDESSPEARFQTSKVFHHLYDLEGKQLLTNGAGGEMGHHRGIFYGFYHCKYGDNKEADTWHCPGPNTKEGPNKEAHQHHLKCLASEAGPVLGRHRLEIGWYGKDKELFATEQRELTVYHVAGGQLVEFASRLKANVPGKLSLDGDPQHAGFQFRANATVASTTKTLTYYIRPDGAGTFGKFRNWPDDKSQINLPWNAMSFVLGQDRYTAAYLDKPSNPKEARYSERDYGRFGSYFPYMLEEGKTLDVNYRLWVQPGAMTVEEIGAKSAAFVEPVSVTVKTK